MKYLMLRISLVGTLLLLPQIMTPEIMNPGFPSGVPSVADVFGGMTEQQITEQVMLGQQFLADLEKFGTPEEKAEFERLLVETLNSMTPDDFDDIQKIAKMVEPNLPLPVEATPVVETTTVEEKPVIQAESSEVENFKALISSIVQRIDDILQKMNSSKEASQEVDVRWSNKATLSNMKRQIYQLRNTRLAQKLSKTDITGYDKLLVEALKNFLKELNKNNDSLVIEDNFGLPSSIQEEQSILKKTKNILTMFDGYIDSLMPMLEKFLLKWDPEALELAKESSQQQTKALKDANDALVRRPSADARTSASSSYRSLNSSQNYNDFGDYGYQDYGYGVPGSNYSGDQQAPAERSMTPTTAGGAAPKVQPQATAAPKDSEQKSKKEVADPYEDATDMIDDHLARYNSKYVENFNDFVSKIGSEYPLTSTSQSGQPQGVAIQEPDLKKWLNDVVAPYTKSVVTKLNEEFKDEFPSVVKLCQEVGRSVSEMDNQSAKKLTTYAGLSTIEQRLDEYKQNVTNAMNAIEVQFKKNIDLIDDVDGKKTYAYQHELFKQQLHSDLEKRIEAAREELALLNIQVRRKSNRKSKSSAAANLAQ